MSLLATQPVSIAKILDNSIKLYTAAFPKLIGFFLILAVFYISLGLLGQAMVSGQSTAPAEAYLLGMMPMLMALIFIFSLLSFVFYLAMIYRVDNVANQREDSFIEAMKVGFKKFPSMFLAIIIYIIVVTVGLLLLVVPGIILMLSMAFYLYFIVIDSLGGYAAIKASHSLVWGHWWRTMAVFMAPGIVLVVLYAGCLMLAGFLGAKDSAFLGGISNLLSAFITPYFYTLGYVQFQDLKLRKLGADLEARLAT